MLDGEYTSARLSDDGKRAVTTSRGGAAYLWDVENGQQLGELEEQHTSFYSPTFSPDGKLIAMAGGDGSVVVWNPESPQGHRPVP